jgi:hypothetical protein
MSAVVLNIVEKVKWYEVVPAHLDNFVISEGDNLPAQTVIDNPNISLYCLDDANKRAIFVETPPDADLLQAPFYYDAQYKHAQRLIAVPYDDFHRLADDLKSDDLILVYSLGRAGSTIISQALHTVEGVVSLSEPDIYTQIHMMRHVDRSRDEEYRRLLKSCTHILSKNVSTLAIKFRGMCIHIADLLHQEFPQASNLFLYRHAETWAQSMGIETLPVEERRAPSVEVPMHRRSIAPLSYAFAERHGREASRVELVALMWLSMMDQYLMLHNLGMRFLAVRYEDIRVHPSEVLAAIFDYCGLTAANVQTAYKVFAKDSQEGSILSRGNRLERIQAPLQEEDYAQIRAVLQEHPVIQSPDFTCPSTLIPGTAGYKE